jgi:hypothetical protein
MPYTLTVGTKDEIHEAEYKTVGADCGVKFTAFTSCIGVIVRHEQGLSAFHLVLVNSTQTPFDKSAADQILGILGDHTVKEVKIIGHLDIWQNPKNCVDQAYKYLRDELYKKLPEDDFDKFTERQFKESEQKTHFQALIKGDAIETIPS